MFMLDFVIKNIWIWLILGSAYVAFIIKIGSKKYIEKQPDLKEGYDQLIKGELIYFNIPWVVAGIGMVFGRVPDFFDLFDPTNGNLFALAFCISILVLWILGIWWIYFNGGAEFLAKHPSVLTGGIKSSVLLKVLVGLLYVIMIFNITNGLWNR